MEKKILLIDGHSILNRAFYGVPELTNSEGLHTNGILGFLNILFKVMEEEKPEYLTVAFDVHAPTFRHDMYDAYKGTRKPMPEELREQVPIIKEVLKAMNIAIVEQAGYEADDILGTIAKTSEKAGIKVSLVSGDRDLLQLASENIKIRIPKTKRGVTEVEDYYSKDVEAAYGVTPTQFIDLKALMGDSSDNIPGVPSIGEKTATKIIGEYGSIENAYKNLEAIKPSRAKEALKEHYDLAELSKVLATIKTDCELDFNIENSLIGIMFTDEAYELFKKLEFKNMIGKYFADIKVTNKKEEDFQFINSLEEAERVFEEAKRHSKVGIAYVIDKELLGISLTYDEKDIYFISQEGLLTKGYLLEQCNELLEKVRLSCFMNLKASLPYIREAHKKEFFDAGIAGYLLNPLKDTYDSDDIARDYLSMTIPSFSDLLGKTSLEKAREEKPQDFLTLVGYLSYIPWASSSVLLERLKENGMDDLFETIEMPLIQTLFHMEQTGIKVAKDELKEYGRKLGIRIEELEKEIYSMVGEEFNINSPKQLGEILFEKMKIPGGKKTKTGFSTAADVLEKLAPDYPVVNYILEYRQLAKLKSTYADGLATYIQDDHRIYGKFNQTIAATGRISSTEPNLQNIPIKMDLGREIRKVFIPEDDYVFLDADYSQIELRVLAHLSDDKRLLEAYKQDKDIHKITASQVFHTPFDEVTSLQRSNAKAVNFGIVYGISSFGLSQDLSISRKEATEYIDKYFKAYPGIKVFLDKLVEDAKESGYTTTLFGRRRPIPELKSSNFMQRSFGERVAMNAPIQGTAADIIKIAMIRVDRRLIEEGLKSRLILQVHDELLIETHKTEIERVKEILSEEMTHAAHLNVDLVIDVNTGNNWFETK